MVQCTKVYVFNVHGRYTFQLQSSVKAEKVENMSFRSGRI